MIDRRLSLFFAAVLALAGLMAPAAQAAPVAVTRFHQPETLARINQATGVVAAPGATLGTLEMQVWLMAVAAELAANRFAVATPGGAALVAEVRVDSTAPAAAPRRRGPVSVGVGGSTGSFGSGLGLGLGFNLGGRPRASMDTRLAVTIRDRASGQALWEGRAEAGVDPRSKAADPANLARRLAHALFTGFPGRSGETIAVK